MLSQTMNLIFSSLSASGYQVGGLAWGQPLTQLIREKRLNNWPEAGCLQRRGISLRALQNKLCGQTVPPRLNRECGVNTVTISLF